MSRNQVLNAMPAEPEVPERDAHLVHGDGQLLTGPQVYRRIGVSNWTWSRWVKAKLAPAPVPNIPGHPRWALSDIERFERGRFARAR